MEEQASQDAVEQPLVLVTEPEQEFVLGTVVLLFDQLLQELQELA